MTTSQKRDRKYIHSCMHVKYITGLFFIFSAGPTTRLVVESDLARRTREEALQTRERILDAAIEIFHERGVARPSLTDIGRLAGVTRGAVYGHFKNKAHLFAALVDRIQLPMEVVPDTRSPACRADPLGKLRAPWILLFRKAASDPQWRRILDIVFHRCEIVAESGLIQERLLQGHHRGIQRMTELLQLAVDNGQLPADLDVDAATALLHSSLIGLLSSWLLRPESFDLAGQAERFVDALLEAIRTSRELRKTR